MQTISETSRTLAVSFDNSYAHLPERFYARLDPTPTAQPRLIKFNSALAAELGLDVSGVSADTLAQLFSGNLRLPGAEPLAMAYAGHQFGHFVPKLGDGRAILLGEVRDVAGVRRDIQLKGSGRTPFSRDGDGRAAVGPVLREYVVSEAMHALGVPTTRALAIVATGESVYRESRLPGAILTRVATSHVRVGTFQFFAARGDVEAIKQLADYVIDRHYADIREAEAPYLSLFRAVAQRQARLIAGWMHVGFIHGVMNTDNTAISGETIDFGPCAFMDAYDPAAVFSSIDTTGRYAYANQPHIAHWNLARFAETLLPLLNPIPERAIELANEALSAFWPQFEQHWLSGMRRKLGLFAAEGEDAQLVRGLLEVMHRQQADFTLTFRNLCDASGGQQFDVGVRALFADALAYDEWATMWRLRLARESLPASVRAESMRHANPAFIPRNHRLEQAIRAAVEHEDFTLFADLLRVLSQPYEDHEGFEAYAIAPRASERVLQTFCGT
jgi:serine/tyrosine/threonine adenylyltransferase